MAPSASDSDGLRPAVRQASDGHNLRLRIGSAARSAWPRPAEVVFGYCSDHTNEIEWNPAMRRVAKITDGPVGAGTRYEMEFLPGRPIVAECADRPGRIPSRQKPPGPALTRPAIAGGSGRARPA